MPLGINLFGKGHTQEAQQETQGGLNHQRFQITEATVQNGVNERAINLESRENVCKTHGFPLMYLGSCHPITVRNDSPLALLGASYQPLGLQVDGKKTNNPKYIHQEEGNLRWLNFLLLNQPYEPTATTNWLVGMNIFHHSTIPEFGRSCHMGNQKPPNFLFFFQVFGSQCVLESLGSSQLNLRSSNPPNFKESAKEMVRDWQRKLRSEVRGVDRSIRRDPAVSFPKHGMFGGGPVWVCVGVFCFVEHGREEGSKVFFPPKNCRFFGGLDSWMRLKSWRPKVLFHPGVALALMVPVYQNFKENTVYLGPQDLIPWGMRRMRVARNVFNSSFLGHWDASHDGYGGKKG